MDIKNSLEPGEKILWEGEGMPIDLTPQYPQTKSLFWALEAILTVLALVALAVAFPTGLPFTFIFGIVVIFIYFLYRVGDAPRRFLLKWHSLDELSRYVPAAVITSSHLYVRRSQVPPSLIRNSHSTTGILRMFQDIEIWDIRALVHVSTTPALLNVDVRLIFYFQDNRLTFTSIKSSNVSGALAVLKKICPSVENGPTTEPLYTQNHRAKTFPPMKQDPLHLIETGDSLNLLDAGEEILWQYKTSPVNVNAFARKTKLQEIIAVGFCSAGIFFTLWGALDKNIYSLVGNYSIIWIFWGGIIIGLVFHVFPRETRYRQPAQWYTREELENYQEMVLITNKRILVKSARIKSKFVKSEPRFLNMDDWDYEISLLPYNPIILEQKDIMWANVAKMSCILIQVGGTSPFINMKVYWMNPIGVGPEKFTNKQASAIMIFKIPREQSRIVLGFLKDIQPTVTLGTFVVKDLLPSLPNH
ncbi:MAG TPA: hypothetical protein VKK79_20380 [Candidatus Lokiarchaeia archaeon]|nr:hypothetical protein [Candidatus Lokiarchaeia archaeon]